MDIKLPKFNLRAGLDKDLKDLLQTLKAYQWKLTGLVGLAFLMTMLGLSMPILEQRVVDEGFIPKDLKMVIIIGIIAFTVFVSQEGLNFISEGCRTKIQAEFIFTLYKKAYMHICRIKIEHLKSNNTELFNNLRMDIDNMALLVSKEIFFALSRGLGAIGGLIGLFVINYKLAFMVLLFIPIKYAFIVYFSKKKECISQKVIDSNAQFAHWFENLSAGIEEIKLLSCKIN